MRVSIAYFLFVPHYLTECIFISNYFGHAANSHDGPTRPT